MNPLTGEAELTLGGQVYVLRYTWSALAQVQQLHGDAPNLFDPDVVADVAAAGLKERHPDMTAERIKELSPPLLPFANAVQQALQWAYFGTSEPPEEEEPEKQGAKKNGRATGSLRRIKALWRKVSTLSSSGG